MQFVSSGFVSVANRGHVQGTVESSIEIDEEHFFNGKKHNCGGLLTGGQTSESTYKDANIINNNCMVDQ